MYSKDEQRIYIIGSIHFTEVKIGVSGNPHKRILSLQPCNPKLLKLVKEFYPPEGRAFTLERYLHSEFAEFRTIGEWFDFNLDHSHIIKLVLDKINLFDPELYPAKQLKEWTVRGDRMSRRRERSLHEI